MATWKKVLVSGSAIEVRNITASNIPEGSNGSFLLINSDGKFYKTGSGGGGGGIFVNQGDYYDTENTLKVTGSTLSAGPGGSLTETRGASSTNNNYAFIVSQSAYFSNHNVGHPNSLAWGSNLDGSIFNNYNASTDVAEILRTFAGLISASHGELVASPTALATKYSGYNAEGEQLPSDSSTFDNVYLPVGYIEENAVYLNSKGFNGGAGTSMFSAVAASNRRTGDTDGTYGVRIDLLGGGSADAEFDAGSNSDNFTVFAKVTQSFSDNQSETDPSPASFTFNTQSRFEFTLTPGAAGVVVQGGPSNTIDLETIATGNPTVIPPQFKKANGANIPLQTSLRYKSSGEDFTNISSSGYYKYQGILAGVATGSTQTESEVIFGSLQTPGLQTNVDTSYFRSPLQLSDITDTAATFDVKIASSSFTSRSLSGAPYLNGGTFNTEITASNVFKPLYRANATVGSAAISSTTLTFNGDTTQTATIDSSGNVSTANRIYDGNTARSIGDDPGIDDTVRLAEQYTFGASDANETNIQEGTSFSDETFTYTATIVNFAGNDEPNATNINYHTAGTFGQPALSGSLAYFISDDGDDPSSLTEETFKGEKYRRVIDDPEVLTTAWDSGSRLSLGSIGDLQVKPGFLVNPESSANGYWYTSDVTSYYKWYLREFDMGTAGGNRTYLRVDITGGSTHPIGSSDIVPFSSTTDNTIAVALIFEAQLPTNSVTETTVKLFDIDQLNTSYINNGISAATAQFNPFSSTIDFRGNFSSGTQSNITNGQRYDLVLDNGIFQRVNSSFGKIWVLVRYKGNPDSITNIELTSTSTAP